MTFKTLLFAKYYYWVLALLLFMGCGYKNSIYISEESRYGVYNQAKTEIVFYKFLKIFKPPKGLSRFPDGGTSKTIYKDVRLYHYNIQTNKLKTIFEYGNLPYNDLRWNKKITWQKDIIAFSIRAGHSWDWSIKNIRNTKSIAEKFRGVFIYDIPNDKVSRLTTKGFDHYLSPDEKQLIYLISDSTTAQLWNINLGDGKKQLVKNFDNVEESPSKILWQDNNKEIYFNTKDGWHKLNLNSKKITKAHSVEDKDKRTIGISKIKELTKNITYREWGVNLNEVCPKNKEERINDIVYKKGNKNYMKAILQEMGDDLSAEEIQDIINKINDHQNQLDDYINKTNYRLFHSEEMIKQLNELLEKKR